MSEPETTTCKFCNDSIDSENMPVHICKQMPDWVQNWQAVEVRNRYNVEKARKWRLLFGFCYLIITVMIIVATQFFESYNYERAGMSFFALFILMFGRGGYRSTARPSSDEHLQRSAQCMNNLVSYGNPLKY